LIRIATNTPIAANRFQGENVVSIKLSEAMKLGCQLVPKQHFGSMYRHWQSHIIACCAMGAVRVGVYGTHSRSLEAPALLSDDFPELLEPRIMILNDEERERLQKDTRLKESLWSQIVFLNDVIQVTREEIIKRLQAVGL
jgi:hypothetical protein